MAQYRVWPAAEKLLGVEATFETLPDAPLEVQLPTWRPGRYHGQDFAAALVALEAHTAEGTSLPLVQTAPHAWQVPPTGSPRVTFRYQVYCPHLDAGTSYLAPNLFYLNPITWALYTPGEEDAPCSLELSGLTPDWQVAVALPEASPGLYTAQSYHTLVDSPLVAAPNLLQWAFRVDGVPFVAVFWGAALPDPAWRAGYEAAIAAVWRQHRAVFGHWPVATPYYLLYLFTDQSFRHAVEHSSSSMYVLPEATASSGSAFRAGVQGITAHELFHTWNVKCLRPAALWPYRYDRHPVTALHYLTEGFTCYYEELAQVRGGVIDTPTFFARLGETLTHIANRPVGPTSPSAAEQSRHSWHVLSRYRPTGDTTTFYDTGQLIALALDLTLRLHHGTSLDAVLRGLYQQYYLNGLGLPETGLQDYLEATTGTAWNAWFARWVFAPLYGPGVADGLRELGLRYTETTADGQRSVTLEPGDLPLEVLERWLAPLG
ncbi:MAG: hypothetical protein SFY70_05865 [Bacteroidia bacterium]|nr:hypothetical protein [Bacteroidia bacterium]